MISCTTVFVKLLRFRCQMHCKTDAYFVYLTLISTFKLLLYLRWLDTVFQGQYLSSLSINYVAKNKVLEKLPPQLY